MDGLPVLAFWRIGVRGRCFFFAALCLCVRTENERLSQRHGGTKDGCLVRPDARYEARPILHPIHPQNHFEKHDKCFTMLFP